MAEQGTREALLSVLDDFELISKELIESLISVKVPKPTQCEYTQLTELLIQKDQAMKNGLQLAAEQAEIQTKMDTLQLEVDKQDQEIRQLQKQLKDAEHILATAIYQAKQKWQKITRANENSISSEDLIRYAHRISASNTVAAPLTWQPGDPRRPYPTDFEMRSGYLGRLSDRPHNGHVGNQQSNLLDPMQAAGRCGVGMNIDHMQTNMSGPFTWQSSNDLPSLSSIANHNSVAMEGTGHNKENEDVEVMSTDSSSSSSSDSQ
ncbi:Mediator of RNA polymerase II transcription subunit 4 [Chamberlinius hualienensis]